MTDLLVTLQLQFPTLDRDALAEHLTPVMRAAIAAGGNHTSLSIQPYDPDEEPES